MTEIVIDLKLNHRFAIRSTAAPTPEVLDGLDRLFVRLRESGAITAADPVWCRRVYLALLDEVNALSVDSPALVPRGGRDEDPTAAKIDLLIRTVLRALGGDGAAH